MKKVVKRSGPLSRVQEIANIQLMVLTFIHWVALRKKAVLALSFIALSRDRLECMHGALPKRFIHVFTLQIFNDVFCVLPPQNRCRFDGSCHKDTFFPVVFNSYYTTFKR